MTLLVTVVNGHWSICRYVAVAVSITGYILCYVSFLTLTAISVDRLLALLLGLRQASCNFEASLLDHYCLLRCVHCLFNNRLFLISFVASWHDIIVGSLCLVTSVFSYTKMYFTLRHHQNQVQDHVQQPNQTDQLNIARYRKAVSSSLWLQFMLVVFYLPYLILVALVVNLGPSSSVSLAWSYSLTLVYLSSSLNPILYCWKIDEVRQAAKDTIRQLLCC